MMHFVHPGQQMFYLSLSACYLPGYKNIIDKCSNQNADNRQKSNEFSALDGNIKTEWK
jgi:hypothetical protein